jgi:hypothetical protein
LYQRAKAARSESLFGVDDAMRKINPAQAAFVERLTAEWARKSPRG